MACFRLSIVSSFFGSHYIKVQRFFFFHKPYFFSRMIRSRHIPNWFVPFLEDWRLGLRGHLYQDEINRNRHPEYCCRLSSHYQITRNCDPVNYYAGVPAIPHLHASIRRRFYSILGWKKLMTYSSPNIHPGVSPSLHAGICVYCWLLGWKQLMTYSPPNLHPGLSPSLHPGICV